MRQKKYLVPIFTVLALSSGLVLTGCGGSDSSSDSGDVTEKPEPNASVTTASGFKVPDDAIRVAPDAADGDDITDELAEKLYSAPAGATVLLPEGTFKVSSTITINGADGLTVTGYGMDKTVLDFTDSKGDDAVTFTSGRDISIRDLKVVEAPKNAIKASNVNGIKMAYTATVWEGKLESNNGAYGVYPVSSQNVLVEHNYVKGSADAGVYVGQSENIVVRHNKVEGSVAGIEIENSEMADVYSNEATGNAGGLLVFDLPGLPKAYGSNVRLFGNTSIANNAENVGGGTVGDVPSGTGVIVLATSDVEIYNNTVTDNDSTAMAISSFLLIDPDLANYPTKHGDTLANGWSPMVKNIYIHQNEIGTNDEPPRGALIADIAAGYGSTMNETGMAQIFPAILYDGLGEALSNANQLDFSSLLKDDVKDDVSYGPYSAGDKVCVNNNEIADDSADVNTGLVFSTNPAVLTFDGDGKPEPKLLIAQTNANTYLNCTQNRLEAAEVTFRGETYGCKGDDADDKVCKL